MSAPAPRAASRSAAASPGTDLQAALPAAQADHGEQGVCQRLVAHVEPVERVDQAAGAAPQPAGAVRGGRAPLVPLLRRRGVGRDTVRAAAPASAEPMQEPGDRERRGVRRRDRLTAGGSGTERATTGSLGGADCGPAPADRLVTSGDARRRSGWVRWKRTTSGSRRGNWLVPSYGPRRQDP